MYTYNGVIMYESLKTALYTWNTKTNERQKLQHVYLVIIVAGILIAGVVTLVNADLGHNIVLVALFAIVVYVANAVVWNLLKAGLLSKIPTRLKRK
ncbi:hypothetical protein H7100_02145 [Candidatus Saccharibacteria bacterium]|nr:hypothetical protein [Candidatus Saccharibacteria bacterium]